MKPRLDARTRQGLALIYAHDFDEIKPFYDSPNGEAIEAAMDWIAMKAGFKALEGAGLDAGLILSWDE